MTPTRPVGLVAWALGVGLVGWAALALAQSRGLHLAPVPPLVIVVELFLAAVVLVAGVRVRAYMQGKRPDLSGLQAARFVMLGKAASHTGAMLAGWYGAQALLALPMAGYESQHARALSAGIAALGGVALAAAGYFAERSGRIPPPGDGEQESAGRSVDPSGQSA
ncbi:hypothetical protein GCM10010401_05690 [Rarobacter faecitabidus]|uniref:Uncharacterized protein DUF3180 n=1 Tax=Rarobacter faecitabidus TaxID=13243 RepID=A0A542ZU04_RARFA|nr:DUF3180 domain-containing protein [Rarobacter faecitabidus]TQL63680.1 uncharacterized protein DUF3180 [Rarobacter faecitabidus]